MPASVALKATWHGDVEHLPLTVTRSVSAIPASCVVATGD